MGFESINATGIGTEGSLRRHTQKEIDLQLASAGLVGGNMGLTTGGSAGTETGINDAASANELRLRGNAGGNNIAATGTFNHWSPA